MREKRVTSLEDLDGKNTYERNRINHAKRILEFTKTSPEAPALTKEIAEKKDGEGLEIRIGSEFSAEEEARAAMKMLKEIHKQYGLDTPEKMKEMEMDGKTFHETLRPAQEAKQKEDEAKLQEGSGLSQS